ncbi:MAG: cob(I)yrinic acid a,c-diamide adenosyltransferase [Smithellaceae bacterium]|nr:cob(I)yrinic acid a,c-diamide adenosyltransferase [Smithellaceae bacterium]
MKKAAGKSTPKSKPAKTAAPKNRGLVIVITGDGKGKTTSAFGQALRAVGQGYRVYIMQFMKGRQYGESVAAQKYLPGLTVRHSGLDSFVMRDNPAPVDIELARKGFELAKKAIASGLYDMVILDEINVAVDFKLISLAELISVITSRPPGLDLILTGRYAAKEVIRLADTVSEIKDIKHHYAAGIKGRAGIEY